MDTELIPPHTTPGYLFSAITDDALSWLFNAREWILVLFSGADYHSTGMQMIRDTMQFADTGLVLDEEH